MEELSIKQKFPLLPKEVEAAVPLTEKGKFNLLAAVSSLRNAQEPGEPMDSGCFRDIATLPAETMSDLRKPERPVQ